MVSEVFALTPWGPECELPEFIVKIKIKGPSMVKHSCNSSAWEVETGLSLGLIGHPVY